MSDLNATSIMDTIALMEPGEQRDSVIAFLASQRGVTPAELEAAFTERAANAEKRAKAEEARKEREKVNAAKDALNKRVSEATTLEEARALIPEVTAFGDRYHVTVTADGFATNLRAIKRGGGGGQGRPAKDAPTGYVDSEGNPILGSFSAWVRDNEDAIDSEVWDSLHRPNGAMRNKSELVPLLLAAGVIEEDDSEDSSEEE